MIELLFEQVGVQELCPLLVVPAERALVESDQCTSIFLCQVCY